MARLDYYTELRFGIYAMQVGCCDDAALLRKELERDDLPTPIREIVQSRLKELGA